MNALAATFIEALQRIPHSLLALLARIIVGLVFFNSGLTKIDGFSIKLGTFFLFAEEYKVPILPPEFAAYVTTTAELTLPLLLWIGFGARFAATALLVMTAVIQMFVYPEAYVTHGLWVVALLFIMKYGAGALSIDHFVRTASEASGRLTASGVEERSR